MEATEEHKTAFEAWLAEPERRDCKPLQRTARALPPWDLYVVREGAPYSVTRPGAIGFVCSYTEDGDVGFVMLKPGPGRMWIGGTNIDVQDPPVPLKVSMRPEHLRKATEEEAASVKLEEKAP